MTPKSPILCYVTDRSTLPGGEDALAAAIRRALDAGVDWIQIREKTLPTRRLLELARGAVQHASEKAAGRPRIILNDRLDVALAAAAHGVHLGGMSMPVSEVQRWLRSSPATEPRTPPDAPVRVPAGFLLGRSCHSLLEAQQAQRDGASYVILGPIFSTPSKLAFGPPLGVARLAEVCRALRIPLLAIGGITVESAAQCLNAGAAGLAAIRLFQSSPQLPEIVARLKKT